MCFTHIAAFSFFVDEIERKIDADEAEIDHIKRKDVVYASTHQLAANARKIAEDDRACKNDALALRRARRIALPYRDRPRNAKADQHNTLKNTCHKKIPPIGSSCFYV